MNTPGNGPYDGRQAAAPQQAVPRQETRILPGYLSPATPPPGDTAVVHPPVQRSPQQTLPARAPRGQRPAGRSGGRVPLPGAGERLALPLPGAAAGQAVERFVKKYATFSGRASRSEFWWIQLFITLTVFASTILSALSEEIFGTLFGLFLVAGIVPYLALCVRRLHDANLFGALFALGLIPVAGPFVALILTLLPSNPEGARFDKAPYQRGPGG